MSMNGDQMEFLAKEFADRTSATMFPVLPELTDKGREVIRTALTLAYLEGLGRGQRNIGALVDKAFDRAIAKISGVQEPKVGTGR